MASRSKGLRVEDIIDVIFILRNRDGAVTLGTLAKELGISRTSARYWVMKLKRQGMVDYEPSVPGSIRLS